jgi:hypothetical protein
MGLRASVVVVALMAVSWGGVSGVLAQEPGGDGTTAVEVAPDDVVQELRLEDGSRLYGRVVQVEGDRVVFRTVSGLQLVLTRGQISGVRRCTSSSCPSCRSGSPTDSPSAGARP